MWPFKPRKLDISPETITQDGHGLTLAERVKSLETRFDQLTIDWEDVLSKVTRRFARDAARSKAELARMVESGGEAESPSEGQLEGKVDGNPTKAQLWARLRAKGA